MSIIIDFTKKIINLPRNTKKFFVLIADIVLCIISTWLAFILRLEEFIEINEALISSISISVIIAIPIFWFTGLYKSVFRYTNLSIVLNVFISILTYSLFYFIVISVYVIEGIPRSIGILQPILLFLGIFTLRLIIKFLFTQGFAKKKNKKNILIYGAGSAGTQLFTSLENNLEMQVLGFLDDNPQFQDQKVLGQMVYKPSMVEKVINDKNIELILLALPSVTRQKRNQIIDSLNKYNINIKTLPSIQDIVDGKISVSDIKDLSIEDLLNRQQVKPYFELLSKNIKSKVLMVTGAGGTIGSEISRQIINLKPKKLLLLELNEFALYKINQELININKNLKIIPLIVNVQNYSKVEEVIRNFKVDTIYHTAAYKHVSLVEENICESVKNNVFGTYNLAKLAIKHNVENFVLISSDKAVRPTNVMGATKRLSEICTQSLYYDQNQNSKFAIVRFGNVLESSGSVIPKFKKQIKEGGPVTLTHPEVTRYFMTISEAAQLVIQASAMVEKSEIFVLDMGEKIIIKDLIVKMIKLSGLSIKDDKNLDGDIEIKITGLRPGEKLYEELLIGNNPQKTYHEKIYKAQESFIPFNKLKIDLDHLLKITEENKVYEVKNALSNLIHSYKSNTKIVDHFYEQQLNSKNNLNTT